MSPENKKICTVVLTSSENYVWTSMQEIIPSIEEVWQLSASVNHAVKIINVDNKSIAQLFSAILCADNIVYTCFTTKLSIIARRIRTDLQIFPRYIFHLHSLATIALWPVYKWGMGDVLQEQDIFISTCSRDRECFKLSIPNGNNCIVPFSLSDLENSHLKSSSPLQNNKEINFVYVGRISSQKNIHTLIYAFQLLINSKKDEFKFHLNIFGGEDNLGSPNMELYQDGYQDFLIKLIDSLGIQDHVSLHGFIDRNILHNDYLNLPHILVSSSLHSDENFGIAALRSLAGGNMAVLSDWGGHTDYKEHFSEQINLTPVYSTPHGPVINPFELAQQFEKALLNFRAFDSVLPKNYKKNTIANRLWEIASCPINGHEQLKTSDIVSQVLSRQDKFFNSNNIDDVTILERRKGCKIFDNYSDRLAHQFFQSYGMVNQLPEIRTLCAIVPPWVTVDADRIVVTDFHRGTFCFPRNEGDWQLIDYNENIHKIAEQDFEDLVKAGFAFTKLQQ